MAERRWTITGWHEGSPGTGGVYVQGPGLEPGELVTVVEVPGPSMSELAKLDFTDDEKALLWRFGYDPAEVYSFECEHRYDGELVAFNVRRLSRPRYRVRPCNERKGAK